MARGWYGGRAARRAVGADCVKYATCVTPPQRDYGLDVPRRDRLLLVSVTGRRSKASKSTGRGVGVEVTTAMVISGRDALLAAFPEDVLSERTAGLDQAVRDIFRAMLERSGQSVRENRGVLRRVS